MALHLGVRGRARRRRSPSRRSRRPARCPRSCSQWRSGWRGRSPTCGCPAARTLLTVLGPAPLVFLALFLLVSDVSDLVFPGSADVQAAHVRATAPVVLVIFDEFPVHSLMGADGRIDKPALPQLRAARRRRDLVPQHRIGRSGHPLRGARDPRRAAPAPGTPAGRRGPSPEHLQPVRHPLRAARARGRHGAVRADPVQGSRERAGLGRRRARLRPRAAPGRGRGRAGAGHRRGDRGHAAGPARDQAPSLRAAALQPRPRPPGPLRGVRARDRGRPAPAAAPDPHPAAARAVSVPALGARLSPLAEGGAPRLGRAARLRQPSSSSSRPTSAICSRSRRPTGCSASCSTACTRSASTTAPSSPWWPITV